MGSWDMDRPERGWSETVKAGSAHSALTLDAAAVYCGMQTVTSMWLMDPARIISAFLIQSSQYHLRSFAVCAAPLSHSLAAENQNILCKCCMGVG